MWRCEGEKESLAFSKSFFQHVTWCGLWIPALLALLVAMNRTDIQGYNSPEIRLDGPVGPLWRTYIFYGLPFQSIIHSCLFCSLFIYVVFFMGNLELSPFLFLLDNQTQQQCLKTQWKICVLTKDYLQLCTIFRSSFYIFFSFGIIMNGGRTIWF